MEGMPIGRSINSIVDKLANLKNQSSIVQDLKQNLLMLKEGCFDKIATRRETNSEVDKAWISHARELVFNIEDWIDLMEEGDQKMEIENDIGNLKAQIDQARGLFEECIQEPIALHSPALLCNQCKVDSGQDFEEKPAPVPELVKRLTDDEMKLKVVSILGMEGLGKTTLANEIYAEAQLQGKFERTACVSLGRRRSMTDTLMAIHHQVKPTDEKKVYPKTTAGGTRTQHRQKLITELREYLHMKRYFILLDGIWSTRDWKIINCALPDEECGSRVLTTTCMSDVARSCSVRPTDVYRMQGLSEELSRSLYLNTIRQEEWPTDPDGVTRNMIKMCGGMPLAITVTAGLLAMKSQEATEPMVDKFVNLSPPEQHFTSEQMMEILHICYADMSLPLRSCFLYLCVFREDHIIKKDRLIRFWRAEGFIPRYEEIRGGEIKDEETTRDEKSSWERGERYFHELITRRLIHPVFDYDDDQAVGCTVHGVILDFIRSLSNKCNLVTLGAGLNSGLFPGSTNTVRRFSLDCYKDEHQDEDGTLASVADHLCRVRSITVLGDIEGTGGGSALTTSGKIKGEPVLQLFKHIRVLDLEDTDNLRSRHLKGIEGLVLLEHLGAKGTDIDKLPEEIGKLEQLVTLDLRHTKVKILPVSVAKLKRLAHLLIDGTVKFPSAVLKMEGLEEISKIGVDSISSIDSVVELLRKSERLSVLGVRFYGSHLSSDNNSVRSFLREVTRSAKLTSLSIDCVHIDELGLLRESSPSDQLRRFELKISAPVTARRMVSLVGVTHIDIEIIQLKDEAVRVLGGLPNVVLLKLVSSGVNRSGITGGCKKSRCTVGVDHGFKRLQVFSFASRFGGTELQFTARSMPELRRLSLSVIVFESMSLYGNLSFGIEYLSSLTRVKAKINCKSATRSEVENAEDAIRRQAEAGNHSTVEFNTTHRHMMLPGRKVETLTLSTFGDFQQSFMSFISRYVLLSR